MIVKNEERFLETCLASVAGVVDEICIVDTGSTDRTLEIATRHRARVISEPWRDDFSYARNRALEMASRRWILVLDADETLTPQSRAMLRTLGTVPAYLTGLWVRCRNLVDDYKGAAAMSNAIVRVFPNHPRLRYRNAIHEFIALDADAGGMPAQQSELEIEHHGYLSAIVAERNKAERNLTLSRRAVALDPADPFHWYNLGAAAALSGLTDEAIDALERMRALTAGTPRAFRPQGLVQLATLTIEARRDPAGGERIAREALEIAPHLATAHFALGKALVHQGRLFEARDAYGAAIAAHDRAGEQFVVDDDVSTWKAHSEIGATLMTERRFDMALAWFDLGLSNRPNVQPLMLNRAKALEALGQTEGARSAFEAAWRTFEDGLSAIEYVNFLLRTGDRTAALLVVDAAAPALSGEPRLLLEGTAVAVEYEAGSPMRARMRLAAMLARGASREDVRAVIAATWPAALALADLPPPVKAAESALGITNELLRARVEVMSS
jgi:tetratricopeptide (TPR) repeat protein